MDINSIFKLSSSDEAGGYYFDDRVSAEQAQIVIVSAPWSVTVDYGRGAAYAPDAILDASARIGLYDAASGLSLAGKVATAEADYDILELSEQLGSDAQKVVSHVEDGGSITGEYFARKLARVNGGAKRMHASVQSQVERWASEGKIVGVVGGEHSVSFGAVKAMSRRYEGLGVLMIDAHCDLRGEGRIFDYSHDSVARNIIDELPQVAKIVEVGVRDFSEEEVNFAAKSDRLRLFMHEHIMAERYRGKLWATQCAEIVAQLPQTVYVSLDVDALTIESCPSTCRPVPGGIAFNEVVYLLNAVVDSGRKIVGFDITEVVPKIEYTHDATVGARMLVKMCGAALKGKTKR